MDNKYGIKFKIFDRAYLKSVAFMLFLYWMILVIWQNISGAGNLNTADTVIKIGLLLYMVVYFVFHARKISSKIFVVFAFALMLIITFFSEQSIDLRTVINYAYPVLLTAMVYCFGDDFKIKREHLIAFFNCVIILVSYTAFYAIIFCQDQFESAFSITTAYGNELTSFFTSNYEYGIYLAFAIIACLVCIRLKRNELTRAKVPYILAILLFVPNLILTYSRTSIFATIIAFVIFFVFDKNKKFKSWALIITIFVIAIILLVPTLREFVFEIVMKGNESADRDILFKSALDFFKDGTVFEKIFGHGITSTQDFFEAETDHGSAHNAYLQVLVYYGIVGLAVMLVFLISQLYLNIKLIKKNRFMGAIFTAMLVSACVMMFTTTSIIFTSPIDSYFLTILAVVVPKFVRNSIYSGEFDKEVV